MNLLTMILGLPLAPVRGVIALGEVLRQQAEQELYDPSVVRRQLEEVGEQEAAGEISPQEEQEQQQEILDRLIRPKEEAPDQPDQ